jgi:hypothetical protein
MAESNSRAIVTIQAKEQERERNSQIKLGLDQLESERMLTERKRKQADMEEYRRGLDEQIRLNHAFDRFNA